MLWLVLGLVVFLGIHSVRIVAPEFRDARVAAMGEGGWKGLYTVVSILGFILLIWGYSVARSEASVLYIAPDWGRTLAWVLMIFAFVALAVSQLPAGKLKPALKHPMLLAVKIWALAHLLANGDAASVVLFGAFLVWAIIDRISVKRRYAPIASPGPVVYDGIAVVAGIGFWVLFMVWAHEWLFGVAPIVVG